MNSLSEKPEMPLLWRELSGHPENIMTEQMIFWMQVF